MAFPPNAEQVTLGPCQFTDTLRANVIFLTMASVPVDRREHVGFAEAAEYLDLSQKTLERKIIGAGLLAWYDFGGSRRIRVSDLVEFATKNRMIGPRTKPAQAGPATAADDKPGQFRTDLPPEPLPPS